MAYDRYDREDHHRRPDDRDWRSEDRYAQRGRQDERGFFERAGDEISSWFGGGRDDHRGHDHDRERGMGSSPSDHRQSRDYDRGYGRDYNRDRERGSSDSRYRDDDHRTFSQGGSSDRDYNRGWASNLWGSGEDRSRRDDRQHDQRERGWSRHDEHDRSGGGYRPMTGDYGRGRDSDRFSGAYDRGERGMSGQDRDQDRRMREFHRESDRSEGPWSRDDYRRTSFAGSQKSDRDYDPNYRNWRDRHMSEIDQDYHDYRRENQSRFEDDFGGWRNKRQEKRGLLSQIREHMDVVGSDDEHVGTVDKVAGDRIILTKSDPASGGAHHSLSCSSIDRVEGNRVILDCSARDARNRWRDEDRSRALFERHDQGEDGPGMLNRSFSGTYRDR